MLKMYFPASIFLQYVNEATDVKDFKNMVYENKLRILSDFVKPNTVEDIRTTILMLPNLRDRFKELKEALYGLILGKDIVLYFAKEKPVEVTWSDVGEMIWEMDQLNVDVLTLRKLRLRKYSVIERVIATDLVFRLYYAVYDDLAEHLKKYRKARSYVKNMTTWQSLKYSSAEKPYTPFERSDGSCVMHIYIPKMLRGVISSCFPLLTVSGVFQLAMLNFFVSGRYKEVNAAVSEAKFFEVQGRVVCPNRISEPSDLFISDCELQYNLHVKQYVSMLEEYAKVVEQIYQEDDPIRHFIVSQLPCTYFELVDLSANSPFEVQEVMHTLKKMVEEGVIIQNGTTLKLAESNP